MHPSARSRALVGTRSSQVQCVSAREPNAPLVPAQAGTQGATRASQSLGLLGPRLRGDERAESLPRLSGGCRIFPIIQRRSAVADQGLVSETRATRLVEFSLGGCERLRALREL